MFGRSLLLTCAPAGDVATATANDIRTIRCIKPPWDKRYGVMKRGRAAAATEITRVVNTVALCP
jgi:hypothetical protein